MYAFVHIIYIFVSFSIFYHYFFIFIILGLNKLEIANFRLAVQRVPAESAAILLQPLSSRSQPSANVNQPGTTISATNDPLDTYPSSRILRLSNMTVDEDLTDDELYQELREDIHEECSKYGELICKYYFFLKCLCNLFILFFNVIFFYFVASLYT